MTPVAILYFLNRYVNLPSLIAWGRRGVQSRLLTNLQIFLHSYFPQSVIGRKKYMQNSSLVLMYVIDYVIVSTILLPTFNYHPTLS